MEKLHFINKITAFAKDVKLKGAFLFGNNSSFSTNNDTDIDLLLVVDKKDPILKNKIDNYFKDSFEIVHHPDFYNKRNSSLPVLEVIVLPVNSRYFVYENKGILTGISGFVQNNYYTLLPGISLEQLIPLPKNSFLFHERISIFLKCDWGINDYLTKFWPLLHLEMIDVDLKRVIKFITMDIIWVLCGKMIRDNNQKNLILNQQVKQELPIVYNQIIELQNSTLSEREILIKIYELLLILRNEFKTKIKTSLHNDSCMSSAGFRSSKLSNYTIDYLLLFRSNIALSPHYL